MQPAVLGCSEINSNTMSYKHSLLRTTKTGRAMRLGRMLGLASGLGRSLRVVGGRPTLNIRAILQCKLGVMFSPCSFIQYVNDQTTSANKLFSKTHPQRLHLFSDQVVQQFCSFFNVAFKLFLKRISLWCTLNKRYNSA